MDMHIDIEGTGWDDSWNEKFSRMSPKRRSTILYRAVRLVIDDEQDQVARNDAIRQLQGALGVDPKLVLDALAAVGGNEASGADIEKLKQDAALAQSNFNGLVKATQTLRTSLTNIGAIEKDGRLPETVKEWDAAVGNVVARKVRQLDAKAAHLLEQKNELERMRKAILDEIKAAQEQTPLLKRGVFSVLTGKAAKTTKAISDLSFEYEHIEAPEAARLVRGEGILTRLWTPRYADGRTLPIECEIYTAEKDLIHASGVNRLLTQMDSRQTTARLKNFFGHDGGNFADDDAWVDFIAKKVKEFDAKNGVSSGGWFRPDGVGVWSMPTAEFVDGKIVDRNGSRVKVCDQNHFDLRHTGDFAGTFNTQYSDSDDRNWYWSSTRRREDRDHFWNVFFRNGNDGWDREDNYQSSSRLVRVGRVRHLTI
jgi:hypothetical protein